MSYDIYVNEQYSRPCGSADGWGAFVEWAQGVSQKKYLQIATLAEYMLIDEINEFREQLEAALVKKIIPAEALPVAKQLLAVAKAPIPDDEPEAESILWVTDGVNGIINDIIPDGDPDHPDPDDSPENAEVEAGD